MEETQKSEIGFRVKISMLSIGVSYKDWGMPLMVEISVNGNGAHDVK